MVPPHNEAGGWGAHACMRGVLRAGWGGGHQGRARGEAHHHEYGELSNGGGGGHTCLRVRADSQVR